MKNILLAAFLIVFAVNFASGQNEYDALKFSEFTPSGTARYNAMAGAFSALGGDLSVMASNPAGIGIYRKGDFGISAAWTNHNSTTNFFGEENSSDRLSFQISNIGFVNVNPTVTNSDWKSVNFGFAYNKLNDFNKSYIVSGSNSSSSILDYEIHFVNTIDGEVNRNAYVDAELIFLPDSLSTAFVHDYNNGGNYYGSYQQHEVRTTGYAGEYDLNLSANYKDELYVGATLGFQRLNYSRYVKHSEEAEHDIPLKDFKSHENLNVKGSGFNLKLGMLYKFSHSLRFGAAIHTPTIYNIKEDYWTNVDANIDFGYGNGVELVKGISTKNSYNWQFSSPAKLIVSSAYIVNRNAIISGEIEYLNYGSMNMSSTDDSFELANNNIEERFASAINLRLGAEYKISMFSLRAGAAYFDSPHTSSELNADANRLLLSGGIGVNTGSVYFDATYQYLTGEEYYTMYEMQSSMAQIDNQSHKFVATLGFRF